jgi:hypothetical protein
LILGLDPGSRVTVLQQNNSIPFHIHHLVITWNITTAATAEQLASRKKALDVIRAFDSIACISRNSGRTTGKIF